MMKTPQKNANDDDHTEVTQGMHGDEDFGCTLARHRPREKAERKSSDVNGGRRAWPAESGNCAATFNLPRRYCEKHDCASKPMRLERKI